MKIFLAKWKRYLTFAAVLSCFVNMLQLTFPFYMFSIYSNVVLSYSSYSLANITIAALIAIVALAGFSFLRSRTLSLAGNQLFGSLQKDVFATMIKGASIGNPNSYRAGINDLETLVNYSSSPAFYALFDVVWSPFYLLLVYLFNPVLGYIATLGTLIMAGLSILQEVLIGKRMKQANVQAAQNSRFVDSFLRNIEVVNGMGMIQSVTDRFVSKNRLVMENQTQSSYYAGTIQAMIKPMQNVIQVCIYGVGAYLALTQGMNVGMLVAASIIMGRGLGPLIQATSTWRMTRQAHEAYTRLKGFSEFIDKQKTPMALPAPSGALRADGVSFRMGPYMLLRNVSFAIEPGDFLGIIGPSGAGKTTLCRLILGIWPSRGKVCLDGTETFAWNKEELGKYVGYLPQEIELFPGTMAENIARLGDVDMGAVERAVEKSRLTQLVASLPHGLDTVLEAPGGVKLSGGQRQRVGLARALYGDPRFLVLDEPSSNLDQQGEQDLIAVLNSLKEEQCTCVMVTHTPSVLQPMDKLLVMQNGTVAMFGPANQVFTALSQGKS